MFSENDLKVLQSVTGFEPEWADDMVLLQVPLEQRMRCLILLKEKLGFTELKDIIGVDRPGYIQRFALIILLKNPSSNGLIGVQSACSETAEIASIAPIYPSSVWFEAEIAEMFGVLFHNSPRSLFFSSEEDLYPLRKSV